MKLFAEKILSRKTGHTFVSSMAPFPFNQSCPDIANSVRENLVASTSVHFDLQSDGSGVDNSSESIIKLD